jgi:hypothetical protein
MYTSCKVHAIPKVSRPIAAGCGSGRLWVPMWLIRLTSFIHEVILFCYSVNAISVDQMQSRFIRSPSIQGDFRLLTYVTVFDIPREQRKVFRWGFSVVHPVTIDPYSYACRRNVLDIRSHLWYVVCRLIHGNQQSLLFCRLSMQEPTSVLRMLATEEQKYQCDMITLRTTTQTSGETLLRCITSPTIAFLSSFLVGVLEVAYRSSSTPHVAACESIYIYIVGYRYPPMLAHANP